MAKGTRGRRGIASRQCRPTPYPSPYETSDPHHKNLSKLTKKDWVDATCSVCMECPHNAVLLLCSSHENGCRPYMCGTSFRYSNCLDQYKKASHEKSTGLFSSGPAENCELACPLCRGQVKGWTVVEPARDYLNAKKRSCMQDDCVFTGTFRELRKHVKSDHPCAKPREVDPTLEQKWTRLEREREREDVMSTIRTSMPGAVFFGDYVIERGGTRFGNFDSDDDDEDEDEEGFDAEAVVREEGAIGRNLMSVFLFLEAFGSGGNVGPDQEDSDENDDDNGNEGNNGNSLVGRLSRQGGVVSGVSGRRRRGVEGNEGRR